MKLEKISAECPKCKTKLSASVLAAGRIVKCPHCQASVQMPIAKSQQRVIDFVVTTTPSIDGVNITEYLGIVSSQVILGVNIMRDLLAGLSDTFGGRSGAYEKALEDARGNAIEEMKKRALHLNADAVVGVRLDSEVLGQNNGMLMVIASGTAVKLQADAEI